MHPTPAVAGQPKEDAIRFIKQLEPHDRDYYTGYLGPFQHQGDTDLFVNLRCMKITPAYISLYVGGGITLESDPAEEWNETRLKAQSLLKIMGPIWKIWNSSAMHHLQHIAELGSTAERTWCQSR